MSPRKVRLVAGVIRKMDAEKARVYLRFAPKRAAEPLLKLLNSAIANAKHNFSKKEGLYVKKIFVDQGPTYKRMRPAPKGVAHPIHKRTSHVTLILEEKK